MANNKTEEICSVCHVGHVKEQNLTYTEWYDEELVVVPGVPARMCDYCGEKEFDPLVVSTLRRLLWTDLKRSRGLTGGTRIRRHRGVQWGVFDSKDNFPPQE